MTKFDWPARCMMVLPLTLLAAACASDAADDRAALRIDELSRELDLAFAADTLPVEFRDTAEAVAPDPDPEPAPPPRTTVTQRDAAPVTTPAPARSPEPPRPSAEPQPRRDLPQPAPRSVPRRSTATVGTGTSMSLTLNQTLSTETNQVGDSFSATLQSAILDGSGRVLIPAGATVRGRLTEVNRSGHVGETGIIKLAFEAVSFAGSSYPISATVVRANPQRSNRTSTREQATKVAAGAAAGAILGRVLGKDTRSTIGGAVVGAAAGTAVAMGTADVDVVLPSGSDLVVRLDTPITVRL